MRLKTLNHSTNLQKNGTQTRHTSITINPDIQQETPYCLVVSTLEFRAFLHRPKDRIDLK